MTDIQHDVISSTPTVATRRPSWVPWLIGGIVVVLAAALGLGAGTILARGHSSTEQAAISAVDAWMNATNSHDVTAVKATVTTDIIWSSVVDGKFDAGPVKGEEYFTFMTDMGPSFMFEQTDDPLVTGTLQVSVSSHIVAPDQGLNAHGVTYFMLRDVNGTLKVAEILWLPDTNV